MHDYAEALLIRGHSGPDVDQAIDELQKERGRYNNLSPVSRKSFLENRHCVLSPLDVIKESITRSNQVRTASRRSCFSALPFSMPSRSVACLHQLLGRIDRSFEILGPLYPIVVLRVSPEMVL